MKNKVLFFAFLVVLFIILYVLINGFNQNNVDSLNNQNPSDTEEVGNLVNDEELSHDMVVVSKPVLGEVISSPLIVEGTARGGWFFEGSFPIDITDIEGNIIAQKYATTKDGADWMVGREVEIPFEGEIQFTVPEGVTEGYVVFKKDNPSDLRELDDQFAIPVRF